MTLICQLYYEENEGPMKLWKRRFNKHSHTIKSRRTVKQNCRLLIRRYHEPKTEDPAMIFSNNQIFSD